MRKITYACSEEKLEEFKIGYHNSFFKKKDENQLSNDLLIDVINYKLRKIFTNGEYTFKDIITGELDKLLEINNCIEHYIQLEIKKSLLKLFNDGEEKEYIKQYLRNRIDTNFKIDALKGKKYGETKRKIKDEINNALFDIIGFTKLPYDVLNEKIKIFFMDKSENLKIRTCFYCNIDFVNTYTANDNTNKNQFTLDHVLPKSKYPYFSLSLFNLVPSCYTCNSKLKKDKEFSINNDLLNLCPSSSLYNLDQKIKFLLQIHTDKDKIDINKLKPRLTNINNHNGINEFIDIFQLKGRYEFHSGIAEEMVEKRKKYSDTQIKEIANLLTVSENQVKKDLFGSELFEETNAPFEKYKKDIAEQLGLIE